MLLAARVVTALSQALFWSVVVPTAAGLFRPQVRGRVVAVVLGGSSLAAVAGLPMGTWLGQQAGWRTAFLALSGVGLGAMVLVGLCLPAGAPGRGHAARGTDPDARRYATLVVMTILATTGTFAAYTYITPFLIEVGRFPAAATGPLLLVRGVAGVIGVAVGEPWPTAAPGQRSWSRSWPRRSRCSASTPPAGRRPLRLGWSPCPGCRSRP